MKPTGGLGGIGLWLPISTWINFGETLFFWVVFSVYCFDFVICDYCMLSFNLEKSYMFEFYSTLCLYSSYPHYFFHSIFIFTIWSLYGHMGISNKYIWVEHLIKNWRYWQWTFWTRLELAYWSWLIFMPIRDIDSEMIEFSFNRKIMVLFTSSLKPKIWDLFFLPWTLESLN